MPCRVANPCRRLRRPLNGVLMCSSTHQSGGGGGSRQMSHDTVCQLFCNRGYVPARSVDGLPQTAGAYHCDRTGTWQPTDHVPSCVGESSSPAASSAKKVGGSKLQFSDRQLQISDRWVLKVLILPLDCPKVRDFQPQILSFLKKKLFDKKKIIGKARI